MQPTAHIPLTLRPATGGDAAALARLAELEEAPPLTGDVVVAELGGTLVAAHSAHDGRTVADIFRPTADAVQLLRRWAGAPGARASRRVRSPYLPLRLIGARA
jgi:hypothetical protein